jgi:deoxyadenosine/deoxycytidine kinase
MEPLNIVIIGNIGAGKTTLISKINRTLTNARIIKENFQDNDFL